MLNTTQHTITVNNVSKYLHVVTNLKLSVLNLKSVHNKMFTTLISNLLNCSNSNITVIFTYNKQIVNFLIKNKINYTTTSTINNITTTNSFIF
jgi:hypothetical protein